MDLEWLDSYLLCVLDIPVGLDATILASTISNCVNESRCGLQRMHVDGMLSRRHSHRCTGMRTAEWQTHFVSVSFRDKCGENTMAYCSMSFYWYCSKAFFVALTFVRQI